MTSPAMKPKSDPRKKWEGSYPTQPTSCRRTVIADIWDMLADRTDDETLAADRRSRAQIIRGNEAPLYSSGLPYTRR